MAFITVEDRLAEIEVIVFARQYAKVHDEIYLENAVAIDGNISIEEGESARIVLSEITRLISNADLPRASVTLEKDIKISIKVPSFSEPKLGRLTRLSMIDPGQASIVVYDSSTAKYSIFKGGKISASDDVVNRLKSIFGQENVVKK